MKKSEAIDILSRLRDRLEDYNVDWDLEIEAVRFAIEELKKSDST